MCKDCSIELTTDEKTFLETIGNKCTSKEYKEELLNMNLIEEEHSNDVNQAKYSKEHKCNEDI